MFNMYRVYLLKCGRLKFYFSLESTKDVVEYIEYNKKCIDSVIHCMVNGKCYGVEIVNNFYNKELAEQEINRIVYRSKKNVINKMTFTSYDNTF